MAPSTVTRFANINVAKNVWWLDVPTSLLRRADIQTVNLLLYDHRSDELHHLCVPTDFIEQSMDRLKVRNDVSKVSLELSADLPTRFTNVVPVDSGVSFASFLVQTV